MLVALRYTWQNILPFSLSKLDSNTIPANLGWRQQNGIECSKFTDFTIWGNGLSLFIISLDSLYLTKGLNHSAQLVNEMVDYRGSSSKLQEQDPFTLFWRDMLELFQPVQTAEKQGNQSVIESTNKVQCLLDLIPVLETFQVQKVDPSCPLHLKACSSLTPCRYESEESVACEGLCFPFLWVSPIFISNSCEFCVLYPTFSRETTFMIWGPFPK